MEPWTPLLDEESSNDRLQRGIDTGRCDSWMVIIIMILCAILLVDAI